MRIRAKFVSVEVATGRGVAERWRNQYFKQDGGWSKHPDSTSEAIYESLRCLGGNPDIAKVANIIGNKSWSYIACDGCNEYVERAIRLGRAYCFTCIGEAAEVMKDLAR